MRIVEELSSFYRHIYLNLPGFTRLVGVAGARENVIDLKGLRDALRVRNTIIDRLEEAERLQGEFTDDLLTFDFVGGGPTGSRLWPTPTTSSSTCFGTIIPAWTSTAYA